MAIGGSASGDLCSCGCCLGQTVFEDVDSWPQDALIVASLLVLLSAVSPPAILGAQLFGVSASGAAASVAAMQAVNWSAVVAPALAASIGTFLVLPLALAANCEWSGPRRIVPPVAGCLLLLPFLSVVLLSASLIDVGPGVPPSLNLGSCLSPLVIVLWIVVVPVSVALSVAGSRLRSHQPPLDPGVVLPEWNPLVKDALATRLAAAAAEDEAETETGSAVADSTHALRGTSQESTPASHRAVVCETEDDDTAVGCAGRAATVVPASAATSGLSEDEAEEDEAAATDPMRPVNVPVGLSESSRTALEAAHTRQEHWLEQRCRCRVPWQTAVLGSALTGVVLVTALAICAGMVYEGAAGAVSAGVVLLLLCCLVTCNCCSLVIMSVRHREAMDAHWTGFYSGVARRVHTNHARSLQLRAEAGGA